MPDSDMVKQACDGCRRRKIRCNNSRPCNQCQSASLVCHSSLKRQKKGRQGKTANILNELRANGARIDTSISKSPQNTQSHPPRDDRAPLLPRETSSCQFSKTVGLVNHELIQSCSEYFSSRMRGTVPILDPASFQKQVEQGAECLHAYCLVTAFCAFVVTQTGYRMSSQILDGDPGLTQEEYRKRLIAEATEARKHLDPFSDPVERNVIAAFLLYGCHIGLGNQRHAYYFLREATTLYTASALDDQTSRKAHGDDSSLAGNLFWLLLISERYLRLDIFSCSSVFDPPVL